MLHVLLDFVNYFTALGERSARAPTDDLASVIANAEIDGEPLADLDMLGHYVIIATAGHDTTSSAIAGGLLALIEHPDQLQLLREHPELIDAAADEIIRYVSPVKHFMRNCQEPFTLHDVTFQPGELLYLSFASANRDEDVFPDAARLDVRRENASSHLAFGFGRHFCLGAHLARMEIRAIFKELLARIDHIELAGEPRWTHAVLRRGTQGSRSRTGSADVQPRSTSPRPRPTASRSWSVAPAHASTYGELDQRSNQVAHALPRGSRIGDHVAAILTTGSSTSRSCGARCAPGSSSPRSTGTSRPTKPSTSSRTAAPPPCVRVGVRAHTVGRASAAGSIARRGRRRRRRVRSRTKRSRGSRPRPSPTSARATGCSTRRGRRVGPRASSRPASAVRSARRPAFTGLVQGLYGGNESTRYLSPAPLYHAAPSGWSNAVHRLGGTVVTMPRFDPIEFLADDRAVPDHARAGGADAPRATAEAARRGADPLRSVEPRDAGARGRAVPARRQAGRDGVVGPDRPRVLLGQRGRRVLCDRTGRVARAPGIGRAFAARCGAHPRRRRQRARRRAPRARCGSRPRAGSSTTATPRRPRPRSTTAGGAASATWAGSTTRATCTSPTGSRT